MSGRNGVAMRMLAFVSGFCILFGLAGCGAGAEPLELPEEDVLIIEQAMSGFETTVQESSLAVAREDLVETLNNTEGVFRATLFEDGYTVFAKMDDGEYVAINTADTDELQGDIESVLRDLESYVQKAESANRSEAKSSSAQYARQMDIPTSKKTLFLNISAPEFPLDASVIATARRYLTSQGWDENEDIVELSRSSFTDKSITPDTMFELGDYGLISIFAHGFYGAPNVVEAKAANDEPPAEEDSGPKYYYIQCCSAGDYRGIVGTDRIAQWKEWRKQGKLIPMVTRNLTQDFMLRSDLLEEYMATLPNSAVYLTSCYGWYGKDAL